MLYCIRAKTSRNGPYYVHKFMLCKKRSPRVGFIRSKLGYLNNYFNPICKKTAVLSITEGYYVKNYRLMNKVACKNLGSLFGYVKTKKRRYN